MSLNKNSSREQILKYIKEDPYCFLLRFSDKPWAEPYINGAADKIAKEEPEYFLKNLADRFPQGINTALFKLGATNVKKYKCI